MQTWADLAAQFQWRSSQRHLLELASHVTNRRWHLCAPPGAGKTLIGLELARQVGRPTLVLAPTTAIRDQWQASTALFGADPERFASNDPAKPAPLIAVTYQLLGNPGEAADELRAAARRLWLAEIAADVGPDVAASRIATTEKSDPKRARRELQRHVRTLRRNLRSGDDIGVLREDLLGERSHDLIEQFADDGIGCVVLDECHHLLDWWALVVSALVERLEQQRPVAVIGLTATLPDPGSSREADNYFDLLGPVDAELQLAAMVAEGETAPWRDGLYVARLTAREQAFVEDWTTDFVYDLDDVVIGEMFIEWAVAQVLVDDASSWERFWDRDPLNAAALARWWAARGMALPAAFDPPEEADATGEFGLQDRLTLVHAWLHDPDVEVDEPARKAIARLTNRYGVALTTQGPRWGRSVVDLVCARSSAKGAGASDLLITEAARRGPALRALVVVERDRATTPPAAAREVLGKGTAARVLAELCTRGEVAELGVVAVTGRGAWADALGADKVVAAMNVACAEDDRWVSEEGCDIPSVVRLVGYGTGWTAARWLDAAEAALDDGASQVLLATRALVGEGWDHPRLNVVIDLSEVASSAATTQLRGRALRLDAEDPDKLVSLWDVVVAHPSAPGDWDRVRRRHSRWWGPGDDGEVRTGPSKLHPRAARPEPPEAHEADEINSYSAAAVADEAATRGAWDALDPAGIASSAVHVRSRRRRRVRTRSSGWGWLLAGSSSSGLATIGLALGAVTAPFLWPAAALTGVATAVLGKMGLGRERNEVETLAALAEAVLTGLVASGSRDLAGGHVVVGLDAGDGLAAVIGGVDDDAAQRWADALAETLGPLRTPRWMVAVDATTVWRVPGIVGATREAAEAFAKAFRSRIPSARLVRAGTPEATRLVLEAARRRPDEITHSLRWR